MRLICPAGAVRSAGNVPFPVTSRQRTPATVGAPALASRGRTDTFPAMTATKRPVRRLRPARDPVPRLGDAVDAFLAQPDLADSSRRSYAQTLGRLRQALGAERRWIG